jgi:hypothetical protein
MHIQNDLKRFAVSSIPRVLSLAYAAIGTRYSRNLRQCVSEINEAAGQSLKNVPAVARRWVLQK